MSIFEHKKTQGFAWAVFWFDFMNSDTERIKELEKSEETCRILFLHVSIIELSLKQVKTDQP